MKGLRHPWVRRTMGSVVVCGAHLASVGLASAEVIRCPAAGTFVGAQDPNYPNQPGAHAALGWTVVLEGSPNVVTLFPDVNPGPIGISCIVKIEGGGSLLLTHSIRSKLCQFMPNGGAVDTKTAGGKIFQSCRFGPAGNRDSNLDRCAITCE